MSVDLQELITEAQKREPLQDQDKHEELIADLIGRGDLKYPDVDHTAVRSQVALKAIQAGYSMQVEDVHEMIRTYELLVKESTKRGMPEEQIASYRYGLEAAKVWLKFRISLNRLRTKLN